MKFAIVILLFALLVINQPSTDAWPSNLRDFSWSFPSQDYRHHRLIKRKGQAGWGKRSELDNDDDLSDSVNEQFVRHWLEDQ